MEGSEALKIGCPAKIGDDWYKNIFLYFLHDSINF